MQRKSKWISEEKKIIIVKDINYMVDQCSYDPKKIPQNNCSTEERGLILADRKSTCRQRTRLSMNWWVWRSFGIGHFQVAGDWKPSSKFLNS